MTRNQIEYAKHLETIRHNIATEGLNAKNLAEVIANNLRVHEINLSKLQLDKLVNDRLDDRERQKLAETVRSNLVKELETNRHNMEDEEIRRTKNAIDSLHNKYQAGPLIAALLGLMSDEDLKRIYGNALPQAKKDFETNTNNVFDTISNFMLTVGRTDLNQTDSGGRKSKFKLIPDEMFGPNRDRDVDEIPTDFSSSKGPGFVSDSMIKNKFKKEFNTKTVPQYDAPIGPTVPTMKNDYAITLPDAQGNTSKVIYHPSAKKETAGPGIQGFGANYT